MFGRLLLLINSILGIIVNAIRSGQFWTYIVASLTFAFGERFPAFQKLATAWAVLYVTATAAIDAAIVSSTKLSKWVRSLRQAGFPQQFDILLPVQYIVGWALAGLNAVQWTIDWNLERLRRATRDEDRLRRPSVDQITVLFGRDLIPVETYEQWIHEEGFDDPQANALLDLYFQDADINAIIDDHWRESRDEEITVQRLTKKGITRTASEMLLKSSQKILTIDQLLNARLRGWIEDDATFFNMGYQLGYKQPELLLLEQSTGEPLSVGQALDLWNKGEGARAAQQLAAGVNPNEYDWLGYTESEVDRALKEGPIHKDWYKWIKALRYQMLGAPDYIRFAVRDVYDAVKRASGQLDRDYPEILGAKLKMLGYSEQDARDAWAAHWDLPSPTQVFEMLHRKKLPPGITIDDYLASADYAPAWRQALTDISYNPITRTDAKRMYKLRGDYDELVRHFEDNGYSPSDARDLADFTKQDVNLEGDNTRRELASGLKNAVLTMYKNRTISVDEVRSILTQLTYTDETIEQFILEADFFRIQDEKQEVAAALKNAYVKGIRNREDTVNYLMLAGWNGTPLDDLMEVWDLLRMTTELSPQQVQNRDLTKTELVSAFKDAIIDQDQLVAGLRSLGYDEMEADVIVQMAVLAKQKTERTDQIEVIHQSFLAGAYDTSTAAVALNNLFLPNIQINNLLGKWRRELAQRTPDFTVAQLEGMVKAKVMPEDVAQSYLSNQGYTSDQQLYLMAWWLNKRQPPEIGTPTRKTPLQLGRADYESMYVDSKGNRDKALAGLKTIGYTETDANLILDQIDRNLKR